MGATLEVVIGHAREDEETARRLAQELPRVRKDLIVHTRPLDGGGMDSTRRWAEEGQRGQYAVVLVSEFLPELRAASRWMLEFTQRIVTPVPVLLDERNDVDEELRKHAPANLARGFEAGLRQLVDFFEREQGTVVPRHASTANPLLLNASRSALRRIAFACLDEVAFYSFLYEQEIHPNTIPGRTHQLQILSLMWRMDMEGSRKVFVEFLEEECNACVRHQLGVLQRSA
ncbi:hypothetical protein LZ198_13550 [Myxococcus sp. K15C18031901]|uniref:hypothetical protein n=1 Tax=Myxococcus dinghuensis TaxID=2906761 RepID=UPI0020A744B0|nr:hypothetical protein [Myxococcus dinghuensis]MCP3099895.1 hypothetical protein [Myxococcus dinghuensis]